MLTPEQLAAVRSPYRDVEHWLHYTGNRPAHDLTRDRPANLPGVCVPWPAERLKYPEAKA